MALQPGDVIIVPETKAHVSCGRGREARALPNPANRPPRGRAGGGGGPVQSAKIRDIGVIRKSPVRFGAPVPRRQS